MRTLACGFATLLLGAAAVAQDRVRGPGFTGWQFTGDYHEFLFEGGVDLRHGQTRIRAQRGLALQDGSEMLERVAELVSAQGLPRRGPELPPSRIALSEDVLRARFQSLLRSGGARPDETPDPRAGFVLELCRVLYLEGDVVVVHDGLEVVRCRNAYFSTHDDRATFDDVTLRLRSLDSKGRERVIVVRAPRLTRQGIRTLGKDVSVTTCTAGEPHFEVRAGELELIERGTEFEIRTRGNELAFSGTGVVPLPNVSFFTSDQSPVPLQGASIGYSEREGGKVSLDFGGSMNATGGKLHELLTGRPPETFRGDWHFGAGWIESRGFPLDAGWTYAGQGLYRGKTEVFGLDDKGTNIRELQTRLDGTRIDERDRRLIRSENRLFLRPDTTLDLQLFEASDPAVWSEFNARAYHEEELPETSAHLRWARGNRIATLTGRTSLDSFSYRDDRRLADSFVREEPYLTFDWIGQPLFDLPNDGAVVLTTSTGIGRFERHRDPRSPLPAFEEPTTRLDQAVELAGPLRLGAFALRPYVLARATHYDELVNPDADATRGAAEAGIALATRLQRTWQWTDGDGKTQKLRHVVSPVLRYVDRFAVTDTVASYPQFDEVDALGEQRAVRFELLQRLQQMHPDARAAYVHDLLWLDLAQTVFPSPDRDNAGQTLGLFEYEVIARPELRWIPLPNLRLLVDGEHDWDDGMRTFNSGLRFGRVLGLDYFAEYRTDRTARGAIAYGAAANIASRWDLTGATQYDLEARQNLSYAFRLVRSDHDWRIHVGVTFDVVTDDTNFFVLFEPSLGGLFRPRDPHYIAGHRGYGTPDFTDY